MIQPAIITPSPPLKFWVPLTPIRQPISKLIQHHMMHRTWSIYDVHDYHKRSESEGGKGWAGIGYNFFIRFDGTILLGRGEHVGVHTVNWNHNSIGVGFQGDFRYQDMTDEQLQSSIILNAYYLLKNPRLTINDIVGHGDLRPTECPAGKFRMAELKDGVKKLITKEVIEDIMQTRSKYYSDIPQEWAASSIDTLHEKGLIAGRGNGIFDPNAPITRAESAVLMARVVDYLEKKLGL